MDKEIVHNYLLAFDEINALTSISYRLAGGDVSRIVDDILSILIRAYKSGIEAASKMLVFDLTPDAAKMRDAIYQMIDGKTFADRVADHVLSGDLRGLQTLVESEYHRVFCVAEYDGGRTVSEELGLGVNKTWYTVRDAHVRKTHQYLEGMSVALDEEFYTFDGDHAPYPGAFSKAENNVGCRCIVEQILDAEQE